MDAGRWIGWGGYALAMLLAPLLFDSSLALAMLSQMGVAIIACLAFNMLLGQGGMLSFGHAVYSGLGAYCAIHTLNLVSAGELSLPVSLVPLAGGAAGLLMAALLGYVSTRRAGMPFAMITLGVGELVWATALMFPGLFGGEGGIGGNRVAGVALAGITYGPQREVYYLIAFYTFVCTGLMYAFTRTPLGRILNAVRDNPERAEFIGYSTRSVRYLAFMASGLFMGISGGLAALHFEIVTTDVVSATRSGAYLLFTFVGGSTVFFGPIIGAVLMVVSLVLLSALTQAWLLYLGLVFVVVVMAAPGGVAGVVLANLRVASHGKLGQLGTAYLGLAASAGAIGAGAGALIELVYHLQLSAALGSELRFLGVALDTHGPASWLGAAALLLVGATLFVPTRRRFAAQWARIQREIEREARP